MKTRLLILIGIGMIGFTGISFADEPSDPPIPEPEQESFTNTNCGPGTTYQDDICVVDETGNSTKSSSGKWGGYPFIHDVQSPLKQYESGITFDIAPKDQVGTLVNYEIISWDDLEYEFQDDAAIFKNDLPGLGILEVGIEYHIIQKAEFVASTFGDKDTRVNATIGYAIQLGDQMLHPPRHENATDTEHEEFSKKMLNQIKEFPQQSSIGNSYDFVVDIENPFYIKFPFVIEESGQYTRQFYKNTHIFEGPGSSAMGGIVVIDKFSKAVDENAQCKNDDYRRLIKYDYSTVVCVDSETAWKLIGRGWGI